jgi:hypothetical protein
MVILWSEFTGMISGRGGLNKMKEMSEKEIECTEACHYASRYCTEKKDGSMQCPFGIRQCIEMHCKESS